MLIAFIMVGSAFTVIAPFVGAAPGVIFTPPHSDHGEDTNGNGLYEKLVVDATVTIDADGWYQVRGELYDGLSSLIAADGYYNIYLMTGVDVVHFSFSWQNIFAHGVDGPYNVEMYVTDNHGTLLDNDSYVTNMYYVDEFEYAEFSPPHSDHGQDTNSNWLYDNLIIDAVLNSSINGWFWVHGRIYDSFSIEIESTSVNIFLLQGLNSVPLSFSGIYISSNAVDGPYNVTMELVSDSGIRLDSDVHTTAPYLFSDFEHVSFEPPHSDYGEDTNSNGLYDNLVVEAVLNATSDGWYGVSGDLYDSNATWIDGASENVHLLAGLNTVPLRFSGFRISSNGEDGYFVVELVLRHSSGRELDSDTHLTSSYNASDFDYAKLAPPHSDHGEDTNGNGLFDVLVVDVSVNASAEGWCYLNANLYDSMSRNLGSTSVHVNLPVGISSISLGFQGLNIYFNGADGPYYVDLELVDDLGTLLSQDVHVTNPYLFTEFEQPGALFSPPHTDYAIDSDSNGFYDSLVVDVSISASIEGFYRVQAVLSDGSYGYIYSDGFHTVYLNIGPNSVTFEFPWQSICSHGADGPYIVTLELRDNSNVWLDSDTYWTSAYLVSEFEFAEFAPPHSDYGNDTNSNGMYDQLIVNASINVSSADWYRIEAVLRDGGGVWIDSASVRIYLSAGQNVVQLAFDGIAIRSHGVDGPYTVDMSIRDDSYTLLASGSHTTAAYLCTDFEYIPPGASFSPPHSDYGCDTNSNGLYEILRVNASVTVVTEGWYRVDGSLYDKFLRNIESASTIVYLLTGNQEVTLEFSGYLISRNGVNGPYHVDMNIYDSFWALCDSDTYVTGSYTFTDFEHAMFSPPHSDHGNDTDSNGYYDELLIDVMVDVSSEGWYWVSCDLRDNMSAAVYSSTAHVYLFSGLGPVGISIPWQSIFSHGVDGPYIADLDLYDDSWDWLDSDTHVTSPYLTTEFEYALFTPPHSDFGQDSDMDGLYEALIVNLAINVSSEGWYWVSGDLLDSLGGSIEGTGDMHVHLTPGLNTLPVSFSWESISSHGVDGPYRLEMSLWDDAWLLLDSDVYVTGSYLVGDFEYAVFYPPHNDFGVDSNSNGLYDHLVVSAVVSVSNEGWYHIEGYLYDSLSNLIDQSSANVYLVIGPNAVPLNFRGVDIFNNGVDGPYYVDLYLSDAVLSPLDTDSHTTSAYRYTDFEQPSHFEPPHSDHGFDADSNGLFDALVVDATINASEDGWYYVLAELYDGLGHGIDSDGWNHVYLSVGLNGVQFSFDWKLIFSNGADGPYTVNLYLENDSWVQLDSDSYVTGSYLLSEFEHVLYSPPHSDYGRDNNGNGMYDELVVNAVIDSSTTGWFWVHARLTDGFGTWIDDDGGYEVYLIAGANNSFRFSFDGIGIFNNGVDGPYYVEMRIYDYWPYGHLLSSGTHVTASYLHTQFEQLSHFSPPHSDHGVDTNSNGQYDSLIVSVNVNATVEGWYWVYGYLYDANSTLIDSASINVYLFLGINIVDLSFSGVDIFVNGVNGAYVVNLELSDTHGWCDSDVHLTAAYLYSDFEHLGASFAPPHSDYGVDTDGNGLYNELVVDVNIDVLTEGDYAIEYSLFDNSSSWIDGGTTYIHLYTGSNLVEITFYWEDIFCHGVDGPYRVDLRIYDSGWQLLDSDTHMTMSYLLSEFEYAILSPPHSDRGTDTNGNGFYEQLDVDILVSVSVERWYRLTCTLYDGSSNWIDYTESAFYLTPGVSNLTISFLGTHIFAHGADGPYTVEIALDDNLPWMPHVFDTGTHLTAAYLATEFEGGVFAPPHSDYGNDVDSDGLYDYLTLEVAVNVSGEGSFWIRGMLYDNTSTLIESVDINAHLLAGTNSVLLNFTGIFISSNGVAGPFIVELSLYDTTWSLLDSDTYITGFYDPSEFEFVEFSPPHSDYGVDTNGNGLFDELVIDVTINVSNEGWYWVDANLYDNASGYIASDSKNLFLTEGANVAQFTFSWQSISRHGLPGPYLLDLALWGPGRVLDTDQHITAAYLLSEFETASFSPPHADHAEDSDTNGLYDRLVIDTTVYVSSDGWYRVGAELRDSLNNYIGWTEVSVYLSSGMNSVELSFPWQWIYMNGMDGPYIAYLGLYTNDSWYQLDSDMHLTGMYYVSDFEYALLSPPHTDHGYDVDGNGLYDWLVVNVVVDVSIGGLYRVRGTLYDTLSNEIDTASVAVNLVAGVNIVSLWFSGLDIYNNGANGPFIVNLELRDESWWFMDSGTHATGPYLAGDFEYSSAHLAPPHSDYGVDYNGNGLYDSLCVDVEVSVLAAGSYEIWGYLYDGLSHLIGSDSRYVYLDAGFQTITLEFSGADIFANGVDGPYTIYIDLYDEWSTMLDSDTHTTGPYLCSWFEHPSQFEPPHSDHALDTNGNGFYDLLIVDVVINVTTAGWHYVIGILLDNYTTTIGSDDNYTYLDLGLQTITLEFQGQDIYGNGVDGPYTVYLMLRDSFGYFVDDDYHTTSAYLYDEFEPLDAVFLPPHSDHGEDMNGNGLYDVLVTEVSVYVTSAGWYDVDGTLYDGSMSYIDSTSNYTYLDVGPQVVILAFNGLTISNYGVDGPYFVALTLYDDSWNLLDTDLHTTGAYLYTEFEQPSRFAPPHSDHGEDTNGNGLFDHLVVDVRVNVTVAGWYRVIGELLDGAWNWIADAWNYTHLDVGLRTVTLVFSGPAIYSHAVNGPYVVHLGLLDYSSNLLDDDMYPTKPYAYTQFEHPGATFHPPHSDYGIETNGNGLFDYLIVEVEVNVSVAGWYYVMGDLYDGLSNHIDFDYNYSHLDVGLNTVVLRYPGLAIYENSLDGPYAVFLSLLDEYYSILDSDTHITSAYSYTEFENTGAIFSPPHSDYGLDTNSNGLFDLLVVEAMV